VLVTGKGVSKLHRKSKLLRKEKRIKKELEKKRKRQGKGAGTKLWKQ
jgi:hypothetical protein